MARPKKKSRYRYPARQRVRSPTKPVGLLDRALGIHSGIPVRDRGRFRRKLLTGRAVDFYARRQMRIQRNEQINSYFRNRLRYYEALRSLKQERMRSPFKPYGYLHKLDQSEQIKKKVCKSRRERRETLFSRRKIGKGKSVRGPRLRKPISRVRC